MDDSVEGGTVDGRAEEEWNSSYTVRLRLVPAAFVPIGWVSMRGRDIEKKKKKKKLLRMRGNQEAVRKDKR